jgi:ferrous iron transport protein A
MSISISALNQLKPGTSAVIHQVNAHGSLQRRLLDLGFIEGTPINCLHRSPAGDPVAYNIRGTVIALRAEDSGQILICRSV